MSYIAMNAAPFENENGDDNLIQKKKIAHNRTQKKYTKNTNGNGNEQSDKVNSVLQSIHNNSKVETDEDNNDLGNYFSGPPPNPTSIGSQRAIFKENMQNKQGEITSSTIVSNNQPFPYDETGEDNLDLNNLYKNYGDEDTHVEYYKKFIPNFNATQWGQQKQGKPNEYVKNDVNQMYYRAVPPQIHSQMQPQEQDLLLQKLNYMIHLLEEKQDERTNNVMEEVVLYSFLGIFIIFIVDSFTRVGKYTRS
jgi:hypothetical protein